jgi:hypothetical protein
MIPPAFESVLIVFQNPVAGRMQPYDDWYTNVHIRDAMRLDGAIATQRFIVSEDQPTIAGKRVVPGHWAHTIYEWESAAKSVQGHRLRATTPQMQISRDGDFRNLRDYFYRPAVLSHGWTREARFRRGNDVISALIVPPQDAQGFVDWFREEHVGAILALDGVASAALFTLHSEQSLPIPAHFAMAAVYSLDNRAAAVRAWSDAQSHDGAGNLIARTAQTEAGCWIPRTPRLRAEDVARPTLAAAAEERRAREAHRERYLSSDELTRLLQHG